MKNHRLKSIRLIELSDHIIRLNRRENTQLDLRLRQLKRQETIILRSYEREISWKRLQLAQLYEALNDSSDSFTRNSRVSTPVSFYAIKMRRNQSAPANVKRAETARSTLQRPNTTPTPIQRTKRAMSVFREITIKPPFRTLGNMLVLLGSGNNNNNNNNQRPKSEWSNARSKSRSLIEQISVQTLP